jgi:16S rRNA processing protein RimM
LPRGDEIAPNEGDVLLGVVLGAHGLKGEVKVKTFTDSPSSLGAYGPVTAGDGRQFLIAAARTSKPDEAVVKLEGISDRTAAEGLKGLRLYIPRAALPEPEDDEFYHVDLVGLAVETAEGAALGRVRGIHNFGAGDVVEIEAADGHISFIPFTREAVPTVDLQARRLIVVPPRELDGEEPPP